LKLTQMNVVSASQYPVAVIYPANNQVVGAEIETPKASRREPPKAVN